MAIVTGQPGCLLHQLCLSKLQSCLLHTVIFHQLLHGQFVDYIADATILNLLKHSWGKAIPRMHTQEYIHFAVCTRPCLALLCMSSLVQQVLQALVCRRRFQRSIPKNPSSFWQAFARAVQLLQLACCACMSFLDLLVLVRVYTVLRVILMVQHLQCVKNCPAGYKDPQFPRTALIIYQREPFHFRTPWSG